MKEQILKLWSEGKSYKTICDLLGCSKSTVSYHCGEGQKKKTLERQRAMRKTHCILHKVEHFKNPSCNRHKRLSGDVKASNRKLLQHKGDDFQRTRKGGKLDKHLTKTFNYKDVLDKFKPECYLTGRAIDLAQPRTYHFDHIAPASKGGACTLDNLGICCKEANKAKDDLTVPELLQLCKEILEHHGYEVRK